MGCGTFKNDVVAKKEKCAGKRQEGWGWVASVHT